MNTNAESSGVVTACAISLKSILESSGIGVPSDEDKPELPILTYEFGEEVALVGVMIQGTVGDSDTWAVACDFPATCLEDRRGGGDTGGFGELNDLVEMRVKLSIDLECRRARLPSGLEEVPKGLLGRLSVGLSKLVTGDANEDVVGEKAAEISSALIPFNARRGACEARSAENSVISSRALAACNVLA